MVFRATCFGLMLVGLVHLLFGYSQHGISEAFIIDAGVGVSTIAVGLLNFVYLYETPKSPVPRQLLLAANSLFIGYVILMIGNDLHLIPSYITLAFLILTSIQVLNHRV